MKVKQKFFTFVPTSPNVTKEIYRIQKEVRKLFALGENQRTTEIRPPFSENTD